MDMEQAIRKVLKPIRRGLIFDSHFVIAQLIKHHTHIYTCFAGRNETTKHLHHRIAKEIGKQKSLVQKCVDKSWSDTIRGTPATCALWQKII